MRDEIFPFSLMEGERLLWSGRPRRRLTLRANDLGLILLSTVFLGVGIFVESKSIKGEIEGGTPASHALLSVPFICVGIYFLVGRFFVDPWVQDGLRYAVTDRRILIVRAAPFAKFTALALDRLSQVDLIERAGGLGTIRFVPPPARGNLSAMTPAFPAFDPVPQFLAIEDARHVFDLIQRTAGKTA